MKRAEKCQFGYISYKKKVHIIRVAIEVMIIAGLFLTGFLIFKSKSNIFTVTACVGALPLAKAVTRLVLFLFQKPTPKELYDEIEEKDFEFIRNYDCIFTSKEQVVAAKAVLTSYNQICVFTDSLKTDPAKFKKSLKEFMESGNQPVTISVCNDKKQFLKQAVHLKNAEKENWTEEKRDKMKQVNDAMKVMCI